MTEGIKNLLKQQNETSPKQWPPAGIKPYYCDNSVCIIHGDCREIVPQLGRFDLLLTDPPYGLGKKLHDGGTWSTNPIYDAMLEWDINIPTTEQLLSLRSFCEQAIIWGGNYYQFPPSRCWLIWRKQNKMPTLADFEMAWTGFDANAREFTEISNPDGKRFHPTQKPLSLFKWCISKAYPAKTILDPFAGSGTTGRAAKDLNKTAVLIEREERYCEIAADRMSQEVLAL